MADVGEGGEIEIPPGIAGGSGQREPELGQPVGGSGMDHGAVPGSGNHAARR